MKRPRKSKRAWWKWYGTYLASDNWKKRREEVIARANGLCPCGKPATQAHHLTYARVGHERKTDLVAVCRWCHAGIHRRKR